MTTGCLACKQFHSVMIDSHAYVLNARFLNRWRCEPCYKKYILQIVKSIFNECNTVCRCGRKMDAELAKYYFINVRYRCDECYLFQLSNMVRK